MAINIKEIFQSDLDPNSIAWWSNDKIDKINYNFGQLSNGGMPGPQGYIGPDGPFGPDGAQGPQGYEGPQGPQGAQGAFAPDDWVYYKDNAVQGNPEYLFPKKNAQSPIEYSSVVMRIGIDSLSSEYSNIAQYDQYTMLSNIRVDNDPLSPKINLRLQHDGKVSDWRILENNGTIEIHIGKFVTSDSGFQLIHDSANSKIRSIGSLGFHDAHDISESLIKINANSLGGQTQSTAISTVGNHFRSNDTFRYDRNAIEGYILASIDSQGNSVWKNKKTIFENFPIGSVISIRESDFNSNNFHLDESITQDAGFPVLKNKYGRGKENTDYAGWYLCNGETWEFEPNVYSYLTPNLNSFNYSIESNTGVQEDVTGGDSTPIIIGGYDIAMEANNTGTGVYECQFTNTWEDNNTSPTPNDTIEFGSATGSHYASRMVHIVYLEREDLTWTNADGSVAPPPPVTTQIDLVYRLTNGGGTQICNILQPIANQYSWTGGLVTNWENPGTLPGIYLYDNGTTNFAASGFYMRISQSGDKVWRQWNSSTATFSLPTTCAQQGTLINLAYSEYMDDLNGEVLNISTSMIVQTLAIDSTTFDSATTITDPYFNQSIFSGWYRDVSSNGSGCRRYYDGTQFIGEMFFVDYVLPFYGDTGTIIPTVPLSSYAGGSLVCSQLPSQSNWKTVYVVTNNPNMVGNIDYDLTDVYNEGSPLFVHQGWLTGSTSVTPPLVNIKDQNRPGASQPYVRIYSGLLGSQTQTASINQLTGTLQNLFTCP